jgi:Ca-activated chloride channel family protein
VLTDLHLDVTGLDGKPLPRRVRDLSPERLPDLFEGDQLVLLGRYVGEEPLTFRIRGNYLGKMRTFQFTFGLKKASTRNSFAARLWASRKIAVLVDAVRQLGADRGLATARKAAAADPKVKELVDEIVRLSIEFGILTEYTAFLAREGTDLTRRDAVLAEANRNFLRRAIRTRSGLSSVNQELNASFQKRQRHLNRSNEFFDKNMNRVAITSVQQISDRAFYRRGNRWVDSRLVEVEDRVKPRKVVEFGTVAYRRLVFRLAMEGRQGSVSLRGDILLVVDGETILIKGPEAAGPEAKGQEAK